MESNILTSSTEIYCVTLINKRILFVKSEHLNLIDKIGTEVMHVQLVGKLYEPTLQTNNCKFYD